jgi:hypothetical protein
MGQKEEGVEPFYPLFFRPHKQLSGNHGTCQPN